MPFIAAIVLYGGTFLGYAGHVTISERVQEHWLQLKQAAIDQVAQETFGRVR